jgi:hypothetical protein
MHTSDTCMQIFVKDASMGSKSLTLTVRGSDTVDFLKAQFQCEVGQAHDDERLLFAGKQLEGFVTLAASGIQGQSTLYLHKRLRGGSSGDTMSIESNDETISTTTATSTASEYGTSEDDLELHGAQSRGSGHILAAQLTSAALGASDVSDMGLMETYTELMDMSAVQRREWNDKMERQLYQLRADEQAELAALRIRHDQLAEHGPDREDERRVVATQCVELERLLGAAQSQYLPALGAYRYIHDRQQRSLLKVKGTARLWRHDEDTLSSFRKLHTQQLFASTAFARAVDLSMATEQQLQGVRNIFDAEQSKMEDDQRIVSEQSKAVLSAHSAQGLEGAPACLGEIDEVMQAIVKNLETISVLRQDFEAACATLNDIRAQGASPSPKETPREAQPKRTRTGRSPTGCEAEARAAGQGPRDEDEDHEDERHPQGADSAPAHDDSAAGTKRSAGQKSGGGVQRGREGANGNGSTGHSLSNKLPDIIAGKAAKHPRSKIKLFIADSGVPVGCQSSHGSDDDICGRAIVSKLATQSCSNIFSILAADVGQKVLAHFNFIELRRISRASRQVHTLCMNMLVQKVFTLQLIHADEPALQLNCATLTWSSVDCESRPLSICPRFPISQYTFVSHLSESFGQVVTQEEDCAAWIVRRGVTVAASRDCVMMITPEHGRREVEVDIEGRHWGPATYSKAAKWDISDSRWHDMPHMPIRVVSASAIVLRNGNLLVVGGYVGSGVHSKPTTSCMMFEPNTESTHIAIACL